MSAADMGAAAESDLSHTDRLLTTTRAVRKRLDLERPVEPEVIQECIRVAIQAPTGGNVQQWRWLVVTDPGKRVRLAELYRDAARRVAGTYDEQRVPWLEDDPRAAQMARTVDSGNYLTYRLQDVPVHVIPCVRRWLPDSGPFEVATMFGSNTWKATGHIGSRLRPHRYHWHGKRAFHALAPQPAGRRPVIRRGAAYRSRFCDRTCRLRQRSAYISIDRSMEAPVRPATIEGRST